MDIRIISSGDIDKDKWNHRVRTSKGGSLFAFYEYLQQMTPGWRGLVVGDYRAVMPLIIRSKYGIRYVCAPAFVRQLGLMGDPLALELPDQKRRDAFCKEIFNNLHRFIRYGDICFNHHNGDFFPDATMQKQSLNGGTLKAAPNYEIDLEQGYDKIMAGYHRTVKSRLSRIKKQALLRVSPLEARQAVTAYAELLKDKEDIQLPTDFKRCLQLLETAFGKAHFKGYQVQRSDSKEVLLRGIYAKDDSRIYIFMTAATPEGRKQQATVFALDYLMETYGGQPLIFDFMGSALSGVQTFIESFGAVNRPYYLYHFNHLPWPLQRLKK